MSPLPRPDEYHVHWLMRFDRDTGEPWVEPCRCDIREDHNGAGELLMDEPPGAEPRT